MADTKISALTTDSSPARAADYVPTYDASAGATKKVLLNLLGVIPLHAAFARSSPADSKTYYFGGFPQEALNTSEAVERVYVPRAGIITRVFIWFAAYTLYGSATTSTLSLRLNATTDTTLTTGIALNAAYYEAVTGLSITVAQGDYFQCKWVTPAWATNPTGVVGNVTFVLE